MVKFKKILAAVIAVQVLFLFSLGSIHTKAATSTVIKPRLQMVTQPKTEYMPGERISLTVTSPNYGGKVEYRVILWNGTTKKQSELWKTPSTGYYYKGWQPSGNYKFNIHWPVQGMEPGAYSLTVLVRRVGAKVPYDSYVKTKAFWIKSGLKLSSSYYESQNGNFKMKFPSEFIVDESLENGINFVMAAPETEDLPLFLILTAKTEQGDSLDNEMSNLKEELLEKLTDSTVSFTEKSRKKVTLGNQEAYLVEYDLSSSSGGVEEKAKEFAIVTLNENNTNVVVLVTTDKDWAINSSLYMQSLLSFVPINTPAVTDENTVNVTTDVTVQ